MRVTLVSLVTLFNRTVHSIALLRPVYSDTTQLNSTQLDVELSTRSQREQLSPINERSDPIVGHDVINKNTTDLAVRCSTWSVEFS